MYKKRRAKGKMNCLFRVYKKKIACIKNPNAAPIPLKIKNEHKGTEPKNEEPKEK
jgi:hypothetical protein